MINLKIRGRLGNQLFQFMTVKAYQLKYYHNEEISIDFSDLKKLGSEKDGFEDSLKYFQVGNYISTQKINCNLFQKILIFFMRIPNAFFRIIGLKNQADIISYKFEKFMQPFLNKFGVFYMIHGYYNFKKTKAKNKIFIGNFESSKFFDLKKEDIKKLCIPKYKSLKKNEDMLSRIRKENSVCITIRRGDFVSNKEFSKIHYVCNEDYFYRGIEIIKKKVKNPLFVVFSDDVDWVKNNMNFGTNVLYETGNDPIWEKIRLMSSCKHFIISNSTFSWWAQYLSENEKKIVIAPKKWKNVAYKKNTGDLDIYQDFWIKI